MNWTISHSATTLYTIWEAKATKCYRKMFHQGSPYPYIHHLMSGQNGILPILDYYDKIFKWMRAAGFIFSKLFNHQTNLFVNSHVFVYGPTTIHVWPQKPKIWGKIGHYLDRKNSISNEIVPFQGERSHLFQISISKISFPVTSVVVWGTRASEFSNSLGNDSYRISNIFWKLVNSFEWVIGFRSFHSISPSKSNINWFALNGIVDLMI